MQGCKDCIYEIYAVPLQRISKYMKKQDLQSCKSRNKIFNTMSDKAEKFREAQHKLEEKMSSTPPPPPYTGREERQRTR